MAILSEVISTVVSQVVSSVTGVETIYRYFNNSTNTYATIPVVELELGDTIAFSVITVPLVNTSSKINFFGYDTVGWRALIAGMFTNSRQIDFNTSALSGTMDGVAINEGVTTVPIDSLEHRFVFTCLKTDPSVSRISNIGTHNNFTTTANPWPIYNIDITLAAGSSRSYAVDTISTTLVDSISGQDGAQVNYDASLWAEVS